MKKHTIHYRLASEKEEKEMLQMEIITALSDVYSSDSCANAKCGCVGYGFVPVQEMEDIYDSAKALTQGTIFPELDLDMSEYGKVCKQWGGVSK